MKRKILVPMFASVMALSMNTVANADQVENNNENDKNSDRTLDLGEYQETTYKTAVVKDGVAVKIRNSGDVKTVAYTGDEFALFSGKNGKIVILNMNINEYKNLSKIIATYLKLDFQTEVLRRLANNLSPLHPVAFISDEYSEYVSATDANFFSQSRESKCINVVSTQGYTSLLNALNNKYSVEVIVQNLVNKLWFRSDDIFTIEDAQKQLRKS